MDSRWLRLSLNVGILWLCACGPSDEPPAETTRQFDVRGYVRRIAQDQSYADILHEAIPDYMGSMTMRLKPATPEALASVQEGDQIEFRLVVTPERSWIEAIERTGEHDPSLILEPAPTVSHAMAPGTPLPAFRLIDQDGREVTEASVDGVPVIVTFLFTRCPLPDYCPLLARRFQEAQRQLSERHPDAPWQLLAISIDPDFDTPEVLKAYGRRYQQDPKRWRLLTGDPEGIKDLEAAFGLYVAEEGNSLSHNLRTGVFGADGALITSFAGNQWTTEALVEAFTANWETP